MAGTIVFDSAQPDGHSFSVLSNTGTTLLTANGTNFIVSNTTGAVVLSANASAGLIAPTITSPVLSGTTTGTYTLGGTPKFPAGHVLQVVNNTYTTGQTFSSITQLNFQSTGLTATITPAYTTSKILIFVTACHQGQHNTNIGSTLQVIRGASTVVAGAIGSHSPGTNGETDASVGAFTALDSPATTSATTYTVQIAPFNGTTTLYFNRTYGRTGFTAYITLMEIA